MKDKLQEMNIDPSVSKELLDRVTKRDDNKVSEADQKKAQEFELKGQLDNEDDWKKRAKIAARLVSLGLE